MPTDDRLSEAIRAAGREPGVDGVLERVQAKRSRRQTARRSGLAAAALGVAAVVVAGSLVLVNDDDRREVAVGPGARPVVRVDGRRAAVERVRIGPDEGYANGPLLVTDDIVTFAAYDRAGRGFTFPPSRIVRVRPDGDVVDRVDLQGEILSFAEGEGARWALTRDKEVLGPEDPEFRVKRIGPDASVTSNAVPPGETPTGRIVAGGGGVWVPVRDGVLRFDPATGAFAAKIPLETTTERRGVAVTGKFAVVTDGITLKRLDPQANLAVDPSSFHLEDVTELVDIAGPTGWCVGRNDTSTVWHVFGDGRRYQRQLPKGYEPTMVSVNGDLAAVDGEVNGRRTVLVFEVRDQQGIAAVRTIALGVPSDATIALVSSDQLVFASRGSLLRVDLTP